MVEWKTLDFKQKTIFACGLILVIFPFIPWWIHPYYNAFWIPLIGMYVGSPFKNFYTVNFVYYILAVITLVGGALCCYEQKNHKIALYGAITATVAAFVFMTIFIAGTCDLNKFYFILDGLTADAYGKGNEGLTAHYITIKILIEVGMYLEMLGGHIISLNYATQYYIGSLPILFGALAVIVAW
ncbi:MAG: hypothetical protein ACTSRG_00590 [Candidatus Helarchaeota archaeon]